MRPRYTAPELAADHAWFKSSYSDGTGNSCVEVADLAPNIGVRDSKNPTGPALLLPPSAWSPFLTHLRATSA
ncbi:DUF397 domain-containing protein [Streptomyces acidiscabies]|uniref:DUF397 domain-containing protein n=1 Tax=Streptomyces acidiscabies TaxID=42234 RepID=UPI00073F51FB|nr:DUF397 domain-containing protein [Streptomyces acidiscabies]GAQ56616.1 hypothetical protein a10_06472 [Streptomyces acidiscabies]GAV42335.1 hypothetical protein Saa2_05264 [Streptomyces acidiscabies]